MLFRGAQTTSVNLHFLKVRDSLSSEPRTSTRWLLELRQSLLELSLFIGSDTWQLGSSDTRSLVTRSSKNGLHIYLIYVHPVTVHDTRREMPT
jgi:hypothetical protein